MVKTMRDEKTTSYETQRGSAIDLLERKVPTSSAVTEGRREETYEEAKERMQSNLQRLLNYDRYTEAGYTQETEVASASVLTPEKEEVTDEAVSPVAFSDEDIRPTTTTLQFGDGEEVDKVYGDMQRQKEMQKETYRLNGKGKFVVMLYSLAVTVILALIILNTGVLASIKSGNDAKASVLSEKVARYQSISDKIESISSNEHVIDIAENDYGMIKGN